jgi:hypothetical protein
MSKKTSSTGLKQTEMARKLKSAGRQKGTPNKARAAARDALAVFMDGNIGRSQGWLDKIERQKGALSGFNCYVSLLECHMPKHQRIEAAIVDGMITVVLKRFQSSVRWADGTPLDPHLLNRDRSGDD